ncbi:MAG: NUDIX hydrolase [Rhodobacteraceae bacterium]|nr:MAG: NUDIX hydrolase [Paracoccaceae bacterium]
MIKQLPISFQAAHKSDVRSQFAALCFRMRADKPQVLLITSRGSGRWIIPKGWPVDGVTPAQSAAREAWEEAGVTGKVYDQCLGLYSYSKSLNGTGLPIVAMIYPVKVDALASNYPEEGQRVRKWFSQKKASSLVAQPELARILKDFDPGILS